MVAFEGCELCRIGGGGGGRVKVDFKVEIRGEHFQGALPVLEVFDVEGREVGAIHLC